MQAGRAALTSSTPQHSADAPPSPDRPARFDQWLSTNAWHPRFLPWIAYIALLGLTQLGTELSVWLLLPLYLAQCGLTLWLLWRCHQ